uniref:Magnesium transporter NIPA2-like n=1 Tax=Phallusia mammillata TaxID=59560 RepID=A0A6F9DMR8_9ASCI|nr:magnesium transporter NIPA2-like [Phallusia mammillata]
MVETENVDSPAESHPFIGLLLSVVSAILVGSSFILQKKGILRTKLHPSKQDVSSHTEFGYLLQCTWWLGMLSMAVGEIINFVAYTIAPAILITPLGALRVIVSALLSSMFLNEKLNKLGKIGVLLSLVGSTVIVIHAPRQEKVSNFTELVDRFTNWAFLIYCSVLVLATLYLIIYLAPRRGHRDMLVYVTIGNIVGALTVLCGKGLGISLKDLFSPPADSLPVYMHPLFWVLVLANVVGIAVQIVYLNRALALFNTSAVIPVMYVFTNLFLVVGSILLFQEFAYLRMEDCAGLACGFITIVTGVVLLNSFKSPSGDFSSTPGERGV